jgi:hypothetical protein
MRFSSIFQPRDPEPPKAPGEESARPQPTVAATAKAVEELPDELDARVRLIGEWQLGEG